MNFKTLLTLAMAGAAGWWVYSEFGPGSDDATNGAPGDSPTTPAGATVGASNTPPPGSTATVPANQAPAPAPPTMNPPPGPPTSYGGTGNFSSRVQMILGPGRHLLTADQWNWHLSQMTGQPENAELFTPGYRDEPLSVSEYLTRRNTAGLTLPPGLAGYGNPHYPAGNYVARDRGAV